MAALTEVQRLQARVEELERWVYGAGGARSSRKVSRPRVDAPATNPESSLCGSFSSSSSSQGLCPPLVVFPEVTPPHKYCLLTSSCSDCCDPTPTTGDSPGNDGLVKVQVALGNISSKRERVKVLFKKIEDLIKYLDPEYIDRITVPNAAKLQFILAEEQFILSQVALLEQVEALAPSLDSSHTLFPHAARLQALSQIHIQQQDQCEEVTETTKALLEEYNKMTILLSKQFVQWDELLSQLEAAKQQVNQ
ncbi:LOW QUALITY PROTEIN: dynactin subunit 3 [Sarcophilus harrisii]